MIQKELGGWKKGGMAWRVFQGDRYLAANSSQLWPIEPQL